MRRLVSGRRLGQLTICALLAAPVSVASAALPQRLDTGVVDSTSLALAETTTFAKVRSTGATFVRLELHWAQAAPSAPHDAADPDDPAYDWARFDRQVARATAQRLSPIVDVVDAPAWAKTIPASEDGAGTPDPKKLAAFAKAAATRYDTARYWQIWNEPNLTPNLTPQLTAGVPVAPANYRDMVNAFAAAVKSVSPRNLVVAGGLAPFRDITPSTAKQDPDWGPLSFMRSLLCLSASLKPTCHERVRFDVWSTHPYTSGGPRHKAVLPNDVSLGDLAKMRRVLSAGIAAGHVRSSSPVGFWVTEFSWDSNPPDPRGVPASLLARWVPQALYEMWRNGVSLVTWYTVADSAPSVSFYQSGLFYRGGGRKPYAEGFRFPFVAFPAGRGVDVWGRTPWGLPGKVAVEQRVEKGWREVGHAATNSGGIFRARLTLDSTNPLRARLVATGERSLPFSLQAVPDQFFNAFGQTTLLEPTRKSAGAHAQRSRG